MAKLVNTDICKDCVRNVKTNPCDKIVRIMHNEKTLGIMLSVISCKDFKKKGK